MLAIVTGKVLVTGVNGYIASWVVKYLLDQGFAVRGTVRSESKATHLCSLFKASGEDFEVSLVEDFTKAGAFDEAVKGVDAIVHTASPCNTATVEPSALIEPAVNGTIGILASALKYGSRVQRIVVTSSTASVLTAGPQPGVFSETDWNEKSVAEVKEKGRDAMNVSKYGASKTLAEQAAWAFWRRHQADVGWDLTVLNPSYAFGPVIHEVGKPENLNESMRLWYDVVVKGTLDNESVANQGFCYVDVRELALAHVLAIKKLEVGGERIIIDQRPYKWQDFISIVHRLYPSLPAGDPTAYDPATATHWLQFRHDKEQKLLGLQYRSMEETTCDTLEAFKLEGWL